MGEKSKVKALCVATRCETIEQFVATFHRFSDEDSFFVATLNTRPIGLETAFAIQLADRMPVLRGTCVVREVWTTSDNPFKRPGIRLGIRRLTPDSELVFSLLKEARKVSPPEPIEEADAFSETPVPIAMRQITLPRTTTSRRPVATPTVPTIVVPPKPPEAKVLEVVMPEQRTPGSELILPANPLMNLTDDALVGFVDCTLYEETANFLAADDDSDIGDVVGPPIAIAEEPVLRPSRAIAAIAAPRTTTQLRAEEVLPANPLAESRVPGLPPVPPGAEGSVSQLLPVRDASVSQLMPLREASVSQQLPVRDASVSQLIPRSDTIREPSQVAMLEPSQVTLLEPSQVAPHPAPPPIPQPLFTQRPTPVPVGEQFTMRVRVPPPRSNKRWVVIGGLSAVATLGFVGVLVTRSSASQDAPPPPPKPTTPAPPVVATPPPKVVETKPEPPAPSPDQTPVEPNYPSVIGDGPCKLEVTSTPAGSMVAIDDRVVGPSPITVAGSCDRHKVDIRHPRYKAEQRFVVTEQDKPNTLDVTLVRPTHQLWVFTNPPGATVYLAGRAAGTSPTIVQVNGFSGIDVKVELRGYAPVTKRIYSKTEEDKVYLNLTKK